MIRKILLLATATILIAAGPAWRQQALASAAPFIDRSNNEWTHAIVSGDVDTMAAPYDENGIFIGPDGAEIRGRKAVRAMYAKRKLSTKVLAASIRSDGRAAAGPDDVYEWGNATMTVQTDGVSRKSEGRYLTVWHRSGKRWVITHNIAF